MKLSIIVAFAMPNGAAAQACADVTVASYGVDAPQRCLDTNACAWLMLNGKCLDSTDSRVVAFPNCCVGSAESPCQLQSVENATDGACQWLPDSKAVTSAPSLDEMYHSLHLAGAVYCSRENIEQWSCGLHCDGTPNITVRRYFEAEDGWTLSLSPLPRGIFVGFVGYDSSMDAIVVSVRGTDNDQGPKNWVANADFYKTWPYSKIPDAGVHQGFWTTWTLIKDEVLAGIEEIQSELGPKMVHLVGHSMGGAVALDGALDLVLNHEMIAGVYTFGAPRSGDWDFAEAVEDHLAYHFRITHNDDPVPHAPPQIMGFYHPAWEVHFPERDELDYKLCDGNGEDSSCANACAGWIIQTCTSTHDHLNYLNIPATCGAESLTHNIASVLV